MGKDRIGHTDLVDEVETTLHSHPDGGSSSSKGFCIGVFKADVDVAIGLCKVFFTIPASMNGMNLTDVLASVYTKGIGALTNVYVGRRRSGSNDYMLSTPVTIGDEWFARDGVIDPAKDDVLTGDIIFVEVTAVHATRPKGLSAVMTFENP